MEPPPPPPRSCYPFSRQLEGDALQNSKISSSPSEGGGGDCIPPPPPALTRVPNPPWGCCAVS